MIDFIQVRKAKENRNRKEKKSLTNQIKCDRLITVRKRKEELKNERYARVTSNPRKS